MTGFMAFLKMQKITKMWECCLCHLHNPCSLIVLYKDLIEQKHKHPQIQLRYVVFCFQNYQTQQQFFTGSWEEQ